MEENTPRTDSGDSGTRGGMREKAAGFAHTAKEKAGQQFQEKVESASSELSSFASALRNAGNSLRDQGGSTFGATALNLLADRVEGLHGKVDGGNLDDVIQFVDRFARRNSAAFVGTAFGLGFLAARFAKATTHRNHAANLTPYDESFARKGYGLGDVDGRPTTRRDQ